MSKLFKVVRIGFAAIVTTVVFATLALVVASNAGVTPYRLYVVRTGSMSPTIPSESEVVVRKGVYHEGAVITFTFAGELVTHRLIKLEGDNAVTKGDGNSVDPWPVPVQNIFGEVVLAPQHLGWIMMFVTHTVAGKIDLVLLMLFVWGLAFFPEKEELPEAEVVEQA